MRWPVAVKRWPGILGNGSEHSITKAAAGINTAAARLAWLMAVRAADVAEAFVAGRFLLAAAADGLVLAHVVVHTRKRMEAAATGGAVQLGLVIVAEHRTCVE